MSSAIPGPTDPQQSDRDGTAFWRMFLGRPSARHQHFDPLDGLRGLAVLIVLASHLSNVGLHLVPGLSLAGTGKSGVYLFFVLSAFLLTRALLQRPLAGFAQVRPWADYALRRVLRIWPLYLVVLLLSWGLTRSGVAGWHYVMDSAALMRHLALQEGQSVLWSIPVEFTFYLWLPLVALVLAWVLQLRWSWPAEGLLAGLVLAGTAWAWPAHASEVNDVRLGPYLGILLCGAFAAHWDHRLRAVSRPPRPAAWAAVGLAALLACVLSIPEVWGWLVGEPALASLNHRWFLFFGLAWSLLVLAILHGPAWLRRPFAWAPLRLLGVVSFSLYLWHMPVLDGLRRMGLGAWPLPAIWVLAAAIAVAMVSYLLFERPWRDIRWPGGARNQTSASPRQG